MTIHHDVDVIETGGALAMHRLLESPGSEPAPASPMPPLRHWLAFLPRTAQDDLKEDGHPRTGLMPAHVASWRRMFGGARIANVGEPLRLGEELHRTSELVDVVTKSARSGEIVVATIRSRILGRHGSIEEEQDHIYLNAEPTPPRPGAPSLDESAWSWHRNLLATPTLLFRFSALTYNAHRIHYDRPYATEIEHYPDLVVHGPLQAMLMADLAVSGSGGKPAASMTFRAVQPAYGDSVLQVRGRPTDGGAVMATHSDDGRVTSHLDIRWATV